MKLRKALFLIGCALFLGFATGGQRRADAQTVGGGGGGVIISGCKNGAPPRCRACTAYGGCANSCSGGYYCQVGPDWCANGTGCFSL